jgi:hypothetical protein
MVSFLHWNYFYCTGLGAYKVEEKQNKTKNLAENKTLVTRHSFNLCHPVSFFHCPPFLIGLMRLRLLKFVLQELPSLQEGLVQEGLKAHVAVKPPTAA